MSDRWRVGRRVPVHVYEGDVPAGTCLTEDQARRLVEAANAGARKSGMVIASVDRGRESATIFQLVASDGNVVVEIASDGGFFVDPIMAPTEAARVFWKEVRSLVQKEKR